MTPLAHKIAKELTLPKGGRQFVDRSGMLPLLHDVHCFECSEVIDSAHALIWNDKQADADNIRRATLVGEATSFLPAPRTWIEFQEEANSIPGRRGRVGMLLVDTEDGFATLFHAFGADDGAMSFPWKVRFPLRGNPMMQTGSVQFMPVGDISPFTAEEARETIGPLITTLIGCLAMINTPRIIGRRQHMPHAGLERALARSRGGVGKFPLHAWTEIKLEVTPPKTDGDDEHEAHLTGARALHFCRAHLRIRFGRLEIVSAHWRGDPALGIKQSRYKLVAGRAA